MTDAARLSSPAPLVGTVPGRDPRLAWWHEARFGLFLHWGLYSLLGRGEWVMELEAIPRREYAALADRFVPSPAAAAGWAALARRAGMRYVVLTAKHHDGFCLFDSAVTDFCAPKRACGRDLVGEYVDAMRYAGLRVGLYYSLMDWHHPDGARAQHDEHARRRLVDYSHAQIRELLTRYGPVDVLWYDSPWPLDALGWESGRMNGTAATLQPALVAMDCLDLPWQDTVAIRREGGEAAGGRRPAPPSV